MRTAHSTRILFLLLLLLTAGVVDTSHCMAQNKIYRYTHMGNKQFLNGNAEEAATFYRKVLQKSPNNSRAMFNLADTYLTKGDVKAADSLYNRVTQLEKIHKFAQWLGTTVATSVKQLHSKTKNKSKTCCDKPLNTTNKPCA